MHVQVMGVVNVTADSFSDGGLFLDRDRAVEHGLRLVADGAAIVDVGGESTRPGAERVDPRVETDRVVPVIKDLVAQGVTVSIDTMHANVAAAAIESGAQIVNDVSGGRADPAMAPLVADAGVPWILMHWRLVEVGPTARNPRLRGRGRRGPRGPAGERRRRGRRWRRPRQADHRPGFGVREVRRNTTGPCSPRCRSSSPPVSPCSSAPLASASSALCSPMRTATPRTPDGREVATAGDLGARRDARGVGRPRA